MKNRLSDLNNHLFSQLERLSDDDLTPDQLEQEVERADAIVEVSDQIIANANLQFKAADLVARHGRGIANMIPETISGKVIEHKPVVPSKAITAEEQETAEVAKRRAQRIAEEERDEFRRQAEERAHQKGGRKDG